MSISQIFPGFPTSRSNPASMRGEEPLGPRGQPRGNNLPWNNIATNLHCFDTNGEKATFLSLALSQNVIITKFYPC